MVESGLGARGLSSGGPYERWSGSWNHEAGGDFPGSPVRSESSAQGQVAQEPYKKLTGEQRKEAFAILKQKITPATRNLNLRTLIRTYGYYLYGKDKMELLLTHTLQSDEDAEIIIDLIKSSKPISEQVAIWKEKTQKSRASFFRKKQGILEHLKTDQPAMAEA